MECWTNIPIRHEGPAYVMYITGRIAEPAAQRATIARMVILNVGLRVGAFALAGLLVFPHSGSRWRSSSRSRGRVWAGNRVHARPAPAVMARIIGAVLFITGVTLIICTV